MYIRENTAEPPKRIPIVKEWEIYIDSTTPETDTPYISRQLINVEENLEFEFNNRVCGFYFNPNRSDEELLSDFKSMFDHFTRY